MKILLAIEEAESAAAAVQAVKTEFVRQGADVHVLHAQEFLENLPPYLGFAEGPAAAESVLSFEEERSRRAHALTDEVCRELADAGFAASGEVVQGDAKAVILNAAAEWHADLIVVGSHGRKGFDKLLFGSVSEAIAKQAPCSVQIVRPVHAD